MRGLLSARTAASVHPRFIFRAPKSYSNGHSGWDDGNGRHDGDLGGCAPHIRQMEARIAQQTAHIVELRQSGQDTMAAARRLALLHHALEEMRLLIGGLVPTEARARLKLTN